MGLSRTEIQDYLYQLYSENGFITEKEIEICCDENNVDFFDIDKIMQYLLDRKVLIQDGTQLNNYYEDDSYDRAKIDYEDFYAEVLARFPDQKYLINDLKKIQPPQRNEWQALIPKAKQGNLFARNRIISMYLRSLFRHAFYFSLNYGCDFDFCFENAIMGIIKAIESYDITSPQAFPAYQSFYVLASMQRNYEKINSVYEIPNHYFQDLFKFITPYKHIINEYGIHTLFEYIPEKKRNTLQEENLIIYDYLQNRVEYDFNLISYDAKIEEYCNYETLKELLNILLDTLPQREKEILSFRYGLVDGNELTLEEIGEIYNLTRERIRQIESKALKRLRHPRRRSILAGYFEFATESMYLPENREFTEHYYSKLLLDDIFTRINFINQDQDFYLDKNEFTDMSQ